MKKYLLLTGAILVCLFSGTEALATHIVGGEVYYQYLGGNNYEITLIVYRDCGPTNTNQTDFDPFASVGIFRDGLLFDELSMNLSDANINVIPVFLENPCFVPPPDVCVEEAVYTETVTLPAHPTGYDIVYQRCCRNPSIINLNFPEDTGATFWTQIPGSDLVDSNSNPVFNNFPPVALCANAEFIFDHSATDADADSLSYSFCSPMLGGTPDAPAPAPPAGPPFIDVSWAAGFSATNPITSDPGFEINEETGLITGTATQPGQYVIGVCVSEYRDGVLLSTTNRDFQFNVTICDPTIIAAIPDQEQFCDGLTFQFDQSSTNAEDFYWDFGDPNSDDDFSTDPSPTYTYSDTGVYEVTLIANPGWSCADTATSIYSAYPLIVPVIFQSDFFCLGGEGVYGFEAQGEYDSDATFLWDFGPTATPIQSTEQNPQGVTFGNAQEFEVNLTVFDNGCEEMSSIIYEVPPAPQAELQEQESFCDGLSFTFANLSENATDFVWDFGLPGNDDLSTEFEPEYTYPDTGSYEVTLIASAEGACPDTTSGIFSIYWLLDPYFLAPQPQCFEGNSFNFNGEGTDESTAVFNWEFDGPASSSTFTGENPSGISYDESGTYDVTLTIEANGCIDSYTAPVTIIPNPTIDFVGEGEGCPPMNVYFDNQSVTATGAQYFWDFGDGSTSVNANPVHTYEFAGVYDVSLTMVSTGGCSETLTLTRNDIVTVYPTPYAAFDVEPNEVDILTPDVSINNLSDGSINCFYNFGDGSTSEDCNPDHTFQDAGIFEIYQTVTNQYGCTDVAKGSVIVNGFMFYAPNAFTPNGDGINDVFLPSVLGSSNYRLEIYNRWGDVIFSSNDPYEPWLGNVDGGDYYAQDGVYTYRCVVNDLVGLPHEFEGHIVLLR